VKGCFPVS